MARTPFRRTGQSLELSNGQGVEGISGTSASISLRGGLASAGTAGGNATVVGGAGNGIGAGGAASLLGGLAGASGNGGGVLVQGSVAGSPSNNGGAITIQAGNTPAGAGAGSAGSLALQSGSSLNDTGAGGAITIVSGNGGATDGVAGSISISVGASTGNSAGAALNLSAGDSANGAAGNIVLAPGTSSGSSDGFVDVAGSSTIRLAERASVLGNPPAGFGYLWMRDDSSLVFSNPAGQDWSLSGASRENVVSVTSPEYGAPNDGTGDATAAIQAAINDVSLAGGGVVLIPSGIYRLTAPLSLLSNVWLYSNRGTLRLDAAANFAAVDLDSAVNITIQGLRATCQGSPGSACRGFYVRGNSTDIRFIDCQASGMGLGFDIRGENGTVPGTVERVSYISCQSNNHLQTYGFNSSNCDVVSYVDCHARNNYLDGFKITALTKNVKILGGSAQNNGQHPSAAGDGLDAFAGGDTFVIDGLVCDSNLGNGITIKTDELTRDDPATFGYVRNVQVSNVSCRSNTGSGLGLYVFTGGTNDYFDNPPLNNAATIPLPKWAHITGGYFEENGEIGLYLNAMGVVVDGPIVRRNGDQGIEIGVRSLWTTVNDAIVIANNQNAGSAYNIYVRGAHVRVVRPQFFGVDPDIVRTEADEVGVPTAAANLAVDSTFSSDVEVIDPIEDSTSTNTIITFMTSGRCVFKQKGTGSPVGVAYGGVGSVWEQTNGDSGSILWLKTSGAPNNRNVGWVRMGMRGAIDSAPAIAQDYAFGALANAVSGVTIFSTTTGQGHLVYSDTAGASAGSIEYDHNSDTLWLHANGNTRRCRVTSAGFIKNNSVTADLGTASVPWDTTYSVTVVPTTSIRLGSTTGPAIQSGSGTPEGAVSAPVGSIFSRTDGAEDTAIYLKESGTGNTGWAPVSTSNREFTGSALLNFPSIAAGGTASLTLTVTGAATGNPVMLGAPAGFTAGLMAFGYVSSANTVTIRIHNTTAAPIDPLAETWTALVKSV